MKVLFDQNAPRPAIRYLTRHVVTRSAELGWQKLSNGVLLKAAEGRGFEVLVTADRNIRWQQNLTGARIGLVVLPSGRWPLVKDQLDEVIEAIDNSLPGTYKQIPLRQ